MFKIKNLLGGLLISSLLLGGCSQDFEKEIKDAGNKAKNEALTTAKDELGKKWKDFTGSKEDSKGNVNIESLQNFKIPAYTGTDVVTINRNEPFFTQKELQDKTPREDFSSLDKYGRARTAFAIVDKSLMPTIKRKPLTVDPAGFKQLTYTNKRGKKAHLWDRCHLLGHQLTGEDNNKQNLTTCTRKANEVNMVLYENEIASYVKKGGKVALRVTPMYDNIDLVSKGILFEAKSLDSDAISYNVFLHNVEDGIEIDYKTGNAKLK